MTFLLVLIYVSFISLGLPDSVLGSAWPMMQPELQADMALAGYVAMDITAGTIVSSLFSDRMVTRFGAGKVTAVSVFLTAAALAGFSLAPSAGFLFLWAVPLGLGAGSVDAALNNFVALHYSAQHMNWLHCFWGIGASAGPAIVAVSGAWRTGYGIISLLQGFLCLILFCTLPQWKKAAPAQVQESAPRDSQPAGLLRTPGVLPVLEGFVLYCAAESTGGLWAATYLFSRFSVSTAEAAIASTVFYSAITIGRLAAGFGARTLSDTGMIRTGQLVSLLGLVVLLLAKTPFLVLAGIGILGLGLAPIYPSMLHITPQRFGADRSQAVMGLEMAFAYIGSTCFPPLFGSLSKRTGMGLYPWFLLLCVLWMLLCAERSAGHDRPLLRSPFFSSGGKR